MVPHHGFHPDDTSQKAITTLPVLLNYPRVCVAFPGRGDRPKAMPIELRGYVEHCILPDTHAPRPA
jgi:hypothetical protein